MASATTGKKLLILNILDILKKYTDEEHRLSQKDIVDILRTEYGMMADRKSVKRNIQNLMDIGYEINFSEALRMFPNKEGELEESYILSDFYLERDFTDSELRLLIDSLLFSKHIPYSQCKELVEKLEGLSNQYFKSRVRYIKTLSDSKPTNKQLFYTIDILDEAIAKGKKVRFHYLHFELDGKQHKNKTEDGKTKEYVVSPFQIAATNGRYYLICHYGKYEGVSHLRLDRIADIEILEERSVKAEEVKGLENGFDLPKMMAEHVYMFSGPSVPVSFRAKKYILNDLFDWFGTGIRFDEETEDEVTCHVTVNEKAIRRWALQYALHVKVLSPASLADQIKSDLNAALTNYEG
ncbi:MAG: WYL domain-containing protein [Clostridia bacterium]|nr:WYL domain-containing protein [Clostridia bacterium]